MRTITTLDSYQLQSDSGRSAIVRVSVKDSGGTYRDLSTYNPQANMVVSASWGEDADSNGLTADVELVRGNDLLSLAPLHASSPLNKQWNPATAYAPLVQIGRDILIESAILPDGLPVAAVTWREAFRGKIDDVNFGGETMSLTCRDQVATLMDAYIETDRVYAFAQGGSATAGCRVFEPSTAYVLNELVVPSETKLTGHFYKVTTAGTSASTEPTWPTGGGSTVGSGSVVFTEVGSTSQSAGTAVESVMQQILNDNGLSSVSLSTPASPGWNIRAYHQERKSVWDAIRDLATQIGWDLRYKWNGSAFVLTFSSPDRSVSSVARTFAPGDVLEFNTAKLDVANIRNVVQVTFSDSQDRDGSGVAKRKKVSVSDSASITAYGRRWMELQEGTSSNIDTTTEATTLATAAVADLATPVFEGEPTVRFFPHVEIGDYYAFSADGLRFTATQNLGVFGYQHTVDGTTAKTTFKLRGKPTAGVDRWLAQEGRVRPDDVHAQIIAPGANTFAISSRSTVGGFAVTTSDQPSKTRRERIHEVHVSETTPFTPDSTTLVSSSPSRTAQMNDLQSGTTYYVRVINTGENAGQITRSEPSEPVAVVAGYLEPAHLNPETVQQPLPPNGSFEGFRRGTGYVPDHWAMTVGTWGSDVSESSSSNSGTHSLLWKSTTGANAIRSAYFPVFGNYWYSLSMMLQRFASETDDVRLLIEWYDSSKASISSSSFDTSLTSYTSWGRVTRIFQAPSTARYARITISRVLTTSYQFRVDSVECVGSPPRIPASGYVNNWTDYGGAYGNAGYSLTPDGVVRLTGLMKRSSGTPTAGETIWTLPAEARPSVIRLFNVITDTGAARIDITTGGVITYISGGYGFMSLDGVTFDTR